MEVAEVNRTGGQYVEQVERENVVVESAATEEKERPQLPRTYRNSPLFKISTTDFGRTRGSV